MRVKVLALVCCAAVAGCGSGDAPTGQVAATVDGQEVTVSQITNELTSSGIQPDQNNPQLSNQALDTIINRSILAAEARERGLDKTPAGALALQRAQEIALVDLLRQDLQSTSPQVSDDEARQFLSSNPAKFADRFVSVVEQVVVPTLPKEMMTALEATDTLDEVRSLLDARNIEYQNTMGSVDSLTLAPAIARQIVDLGPGEVYILPQGDGARINAVVSRRPYPISGDAALDLAKQFVAQQRSTGQADSVFRSILTERKKGVKYADQYAAPQAPTNGASGSAPSATPKQ